MSSIIDELMGLLKNKKIIAIIVSLVVGVVIMNILINVFREDIRNQQIASVGEVVYENKQFVPIKESEITEVVKNKDLSVLALIESADNKGLKKVEKMFQSKDPIEGLPSQVFVYEPVYDSAEIKKEFNVNDKNTFIVIEKGKEIGRFSFNDLSIGYEEIVDELDTIINPKINRKKPVRITPEESVNEDAGQDLTGAEETHTSEVTFE